MTPIVRKVAHTALLSAGLLAVNSLVPARASAAEAEECRFETACKCDPKTGDCTCYIRLICDVE